MSAVGVQRADRQGRDRVAEAAFSESRLGAEAAARLRSAFARLETPMLLVDDRRWCITANDAAYALLGQTQADLPWLRIDDLADEAELRHLIAQWANLIATEGMEGWSALRLPQGDSLPVECCATAHVLPSRHLLIFVPGETDTSGKTDFETARAIDWTPFAVEPDRDARLTKREREVLTLVAMGARNREIAEQLFITPETVKSHLTRSMAKLDTHTRAGAVTIALVTGEIDWER